MRIIKKKKITIRFAVLCVPLLLIAGCFPIRPGPDHKSLHVDYERIQYSIACEFIRAWEMEYAFHDSSLKDAAFWDLAITINHTRTGTAGLKGTGAKTDVINNWTKVFDVGVNPTSTGVYKLTASLGLRVPFATFTKESLKLAKNLRGKQVVENRGLIYADKFATECADPYLNMKQMAVFSQFENFVKGFEPERTRDLKYTNLNFEDTGRLILSTGGTFTYALVPYKVVLPPVLSYTDELHIQAFATRKRAPTPEEEAKAKREKQRGSNVYVTNLNQIPGGSSGRLSADEIRILACRINYPDSGDVEKYNKCISHKKASSFTITGVQRPGSPGTSDFRGSAFQTDDSSAGSSFESLLNTPKGFTADPDRERRRQLLEDQVEEVLEELN